MTIRFEKLKARLLANPTVKAEYDALAPEFEIAADIDGTAGQGRGSDERPVRRSSSSDDGA
jgi:hypothetical protein